jgi:hypothetical protein
MRKLIFLFCIFSGLHSAAQDKSAYDSLLTLAEEVELSDSLHINAEPKRKNLLDSSSVKKWFSPLLGSGPNNRLKNRAYYLAGKITSNEIFNLLVLMEKKKKTDSAGVQVVYLVTTKKDGTYIASIEAAIGGIKRKSSYNTSSWLYKDFRVVLDSKMTVNDKSYYDLSNYKINKGGRFILYPKYE